jgi:hypothetical protein
MTKRQTNALPRIELLISDLCCQIEVLSTNRPATSDNTLEQIVIRQLIAMGVLDVTSHNGRPNMLMNSPMMSIMDTAWLALP